MRVVLLASLALAAAASTPAFAQAPGGVEKSNMELVGSHDLQARSAYQPLVHRQGDRWIAYIGHHGGKNVNALNGANEDNGTSILDVTQPRDPKLIFHIPGEPGQGESGGAQMVRVCDGATLPNADKSKVYLLRTYGNAAHEVWDVSNPARPLSSNIRTGRPRHHHRTAFAEPPHQCANLRLRCIDFGPLHRPLVARSGRRHPHRPDQTQ